MNARKINKLEKMIKSWKMKDYIRQLSIVILGIIVTFAASNAITDYSESQEIKSALRLVRDELVLNREAVKRISARIELEQNVFRYILKFKDHIEEAPEDTLRTYQFMPFQTRRVIYAKDAGELLKTSSLFQKIEPKSLALQIIKAYNDLEIVSLNVSGFYATKDDHITRLLNNKEFDFYSDEYKSSVYGYWKKLLSSREGWNICNFVVNNFSSSTPFQEIEVNLERTIEMLNKEYGLE